jgi:mono/diheme cytochrome c family protein
MNTSKQVNAMIGLLGLLLLMLGAYFVYESTRQAEADEHLTERNAERGARIFVNNCRSCHGMEGLGPEEGAIAPQLNTSAFLILDEDNEYGAEPTAQGEADGIRNFLRNTITCGRTGTFMPPWSEDHGGALSATRIDQVVTLITEGRWDLVEEIGAEHDAETGDTAEEIVITDASTLSQTQSNCGQFNAVTALPFRTREDPRLVTAVPDGETPPAGTPEPGGTEPAGGSVQSVPVADFFQATCAACHGADRAGITGLGLPLTPDALTQPDEFYFDTIAEGRPGTVMPSWRANGLTDEEIQTLVEFITTVEP